MPVYASLCTIQTIHAATVFAENNARAIRSLLLSRLGIFSSTTMAPSRIGCISEVIRYTQVKAVQVNLGITL
ncbi:hypothetical protein BDZ89DRAFT_1129560 [Hymenopellis radicata]|nr:hypothetical protein BDZ89DRAFT_1129560 [Hymenopellis radicata]